MIQIKFQDPPALKRRRTDWDSVADQLKQRPGEWALIGNRHSSVASQIKKGQYRAFPAGEFEAICRNVRDHKADIYVRYVGGAA